MATEGETDVSERFLQQALDHRLEIVFVETFVRPTRRWTHSG